MEPPFVVQRDGSKILASLPIAQLFQIQRAARKLMWQAIVMSDPQAKQQVEKMFASLQPSDGRAVILTLVLQDACSEAETIRQEMMMMEQQKIREAEQRDAAAYRAQQAAQQAAQRGVPPGAPSGPVAGVPPPPQQSAQDQFFCTHGVPLPNLASGGSSVRCLECEAARSGAKNQTERAQ